MLGFVVLFLRVLWFLVFEGPFRTLLLLLAPGVRS